jgi:cold shock CspA family protein
MATGRITRIQYDKGFGFIMESGGAAPTGARSGNDLFFHRTAVVEGVFDDLREGQEVSFESGPDPRDPSRFRASDVRAVAGEEA